MGVVYQWPVAARLSATDEQGSIPSPSEEDDAAPPKESPRGFLQTSRRELTEEELSTPAARRFLIFEIERLDKECVDHRQYIEQYHDQRVIIATLEEKIHRSRWSEVLSTLCISAGSVGVGAVPSYLTAPNMQSYGYVILGVSSILILAGVASRIWK
jgi:hypothetical protein